MRFHLGKGEITLINFGTAFLLAKIVSLLVNLLLTNWTQLDGNSSTLISRSTELICILTLLAANLLPNNFPFRTLLQAPRSTETSNARNQILATLIIVVISRYVMELLLVLPNAFRDLGTLQDNKQFKSSIDFTLISVTSLFLGKNILAQITMVPIVEEIIYRGILLNLLLRRFNVTNSILLSSLAFAVLHGNPITAFLGGLLFAHIYVMTKNLWLCILGHSFANITVLFLNRYGDYVYPSFGSDTSINGPNIWLCTLLTIVWMIAMTIFTLRYRHMFLESAFSKSVMQHSENPSDMRT